MNGWRPRMAAATAAWLLLAAGCSSPRQAAPAGSTALPPAATRDRAATRDATSRVIVVVEENHSIGQIIGSPQAPFLNRLAAKGALLTSYFAITHPSLPNYIAMVSGDTQGITSDCGGCNVDAPNPVDQLDTDLAAGQLPRLMFVIPNMDHDMHGVGEGGDDQR